MDFMIPFDRYVQEYKYKYLALYQALRTAILAGAIPNGTKLPSSREMAGLYQLSRGSVNQVYEMLLSEGYVTASVGRGTFVSYDPQSSVGTKEHPSGITIELSAWGQRMMEQLPRFTAEGKLSADGDRIHLEMDRSTMEGFPQAEWSHALYQEIKLMHAIGQARAGEHAAGYEPLREAIAQHLRRMRGIQTTKEQILICNGSMQVIALLMQLLVDEGDGVIVENPGYGGTGRAIEAVGGIVKPQPLDEHGLIVQSWQEKLAFVTPSRQFPTGTVMSLARRQQLLAWASAGQAIIIEDDYDSEIRYGGRPIEPLKALDQEERVVYIGTFSKTMYRDLRIGYAVLPNSLVDPMQRAKQLYEPTSTSLLEQRALAHFMQNGSYERHLRRLRRRYSKKFSFFCRTLQEHVGHLFNIIASDAGMHIFAMWNGTVEEYHEFRQLAADEGVCWTDSDRFHFLSNDTPAACFGFTHLQEDQLLQGVLRMKTAWMKTKSDNSLET